jgi:hypothetical protein
MVNSDSLHEELLHLLVLACTDVLVKAFPGGVVLTAEVLGHAFFERLLVELHTRLDGLLPSMDKDHDLMALSDVVRHL